MSAQMRHAIVMRRNSGERVILQMRGSYRCLSQQRRWRGIHIWPPDSALRSAQAPSHEDAISRRAQARLYKVCSGTIRVRANEIDRRPATEVQQ
ncbi:protein of unknown function [Paraburkholderia kururiensis]